MPLLLSDNNLHAGMLALQRNLLSMAFVPLQNRAYAHCSKIGSKGLVVSGTWSDADNKTLLQ